MPLKNARIHLRVTDEEKQSLVEKAAMARQSVSQYRTSNTIAGRKAVT